MAQWGQLSPSDLSAGTFYPSRFIETCGGPSTELNAYKAQRNLTVVF